MSAQSLSSTAGRVWRTPRRDRPRARARRYLLTGLMWALAGLFVLPFAWMLSASLKNNIDVFSIPVQWIPDPVRLANYADVWLGGRSIGRYLLNSVIVSGVGLVGDLTTSSMAGYAFGQLAFRGRNKVFLLYLSTTIVPMQLLIIPRFMLFQQLGIYDTLWALILPGVFTVFGTFLMRQSFASMPAELGEAARIDGAGEWRVFWQIYLPQARAMLAALAIISFVSSWNDYEGPLIMLSTESRYTIPLGLTQFVDVDGGLSAGLAMAAGVSSIVPLLVVFLVFQRQFVRSMVHAGLRG